MISCHRVVVYVEVDIGLNMPEMLKNNVFLRDNFEGNQFKLFFFIHIFIHGPIMESKTLTIEKLSG